MSKRITLSDADLEVLDICLSAAIKNNFYIAQANVGKRTIQRLLRKLGIPYDATRRNET